MKKCLISHRLALSILGMAAFVPVFPCVAQTEPAAVITETPSITIHIDKTKAKVSPTFYGLMTEEINYSYDGGLYAELIRNRAFKDDPKQAVHWSLVQPDGGNAKMELDSTQPLNDAMPVSLKLSVPELQPGQKVAVSNDGYWGIPVKPNTTYTASFYAKGVEGFSGPLGVSIEDASGAKTFAKADVAKISTEWKKYTVTLKTGDAEAGTDNRFVISSTTPGSVLFSFVSLFPPTFKDLPNGNRPDLMEKLNALNPTFLRFPGGNYVEGQNFENRFDWKKTIGDVAQRPGHLSPWRYRSTDGMGLLEFLEWCEDMKSEPVLAVFAGYTLDRKYVEAGKDLEPYVQEALEEIEYVTGDATTKWGAKRIADGHKEPFKLTYVEIGNEDFFDRSGSYNGRYAQFYDAIKKKYPNLQLIATTAVKGHVMDVIDEHYYYNSSTAAEANSLRYDKYDRNGPKIFVGEWATRTGAPTTNMNAAIGDAAFMTNMERNSDIVVMNCYAPLFVNINPAGPGNPRGMQWPSDLIGYNNLESYGCPSYYMQKMFTENMGDVILDTESKHIPTILPPPPAPRRNNDAAAATTATSQAARPARPPTPVDQLFYSATMDSKKGTIYIKVVNATPAPLTTDLHLLGSSTLSGDAAAITLSAENVTDTNTIKEPKKVIPVESKVSGIKSEFTHTFPASSVTVLRIESK